MTNCDKEAIKTLVVLRGQRKAARVAGLSENTVKSWALRYGWNKLPKPSPHLTHPIRTQSPAAIVADELSQNKACSTLALSRYSARAAEKAAAHEDPLSISRKVKDVAGVHRTLWPNESAREEILQVDLLIGKVKLDPIPPGKGGHNPDTWAKWVSEHGERDTAALLDAEQDPGKE